MGGEENVRGSWWGHSLREGHGSSKADVGHPLASSLAEPQFPHHKLEALHRVGENIDRQYRQNTWTDTTERQYTYEKDLAFIIHQRNTN